MNATYMFEVMMALGAYWGTSCIQGNRSRKRLFLTAALFNTFIFYFLTTDPEGENGLT